jgi:anti-sigma factor RsiW
MMERPPVDHIDDALLARFSSGELSEPEAAALALHLDDCPRCAARALMDDPLQAAFASLDDPATPPDLVPAVLAASLRPRPLPAEPIVAIVLIAVAFGVLVLGGQPVQLLTEGLLLVRSALVTASALGFTSALPSTLAAIGGMVLLGLAIATATRLDARRSEA